MRQQSWLPKSETSVVLPLTNLQAAILAKTLVGLLLLPGTGNQADPAYLADASTTASCALPFDVWACGASALSASSVGAFGALAAAAFLLPPRPPFDPPRCLPVLVPRVPFRCPPWALSAAPLVCSVFLVNSLALILDLAISSRSGLPRTSAAFS